MTTATNAVALQALLNRAKALTDDASPEQLAYLGKAIESVGGKATAFEIMALGDEQKTAITTLSEEQRAALSLKLDQYLGTISEQGNEQDQRIQLAGSAELENIQQAGQQNISGVSAEGDRQLALIQQAGGTVLTPQQQGILPGSRPFLFGVAEHFSANGASYTSELGQFHSGAGKTLFELICGIQSNPLYNKWIQPPALQFIAGDTWHYSEQKTTFAASGNLYTYPMFMLSVLFVKNTTDQAITRSLGRRYSSYGSSYGYASLNVGTPDVDEAIDWQTIKSYTGSSADYTDSENISIPAGKTVAIVFYNSANYWTSSGGYQFVLRHAFTGMNTFLGDGLEVDVERTLRAQQQPVSHDHEIWGGES